MTPRSTTPEDPTTDLLLHSIPAVHKPGEPCELCAIRAESSAEIERLREAVRELRDYIAGLPAREGAGLHFAISQVQILDQFRLDPVLRAALAPADAAGREDER